MTTKVHKFLGVTILQREKGISTRFSYVFELNGQSRVTRSLDRAKQAISEFLQSK